MRSGSRPLSARSVAARLDADRPWVLAAGFFFAGALRVVAGFFFVVATSWVTPP